MAGLRVDTASGLQRVIAPGNAANSTLIQRVTSTKPGFKMPPVGEPLSSTEIATIRDWIDGGAKAPVEKAAAAPRSSHWSFQPIKRAAVPTVQKQGWVRNPIDAFILARLEAEKIEPSPEASKTTLLRRASLDLTGLPPTPAEIDEFLSDKRPDAYEHAVDRLLASPHYGEKWARHWLDLARYADSDGYEKDLVRPYAWRYRQWVIDALNQDMPFDQFTVEQIAGDLLPKPTVEQRIATGISSQRSGESRGRCRSRGGAIRAERESREHGRHGVARTDGRMRAVPRPQVRSDQPAGVLPAVCVHFRTSKRTISMRRCPARLARI